MDILSIAYPKQKSDMKKIKYLKRNYDQMLMDINYAEPQKFQLPHPDLASRGFSKASFFLQFKFLIERAWL